MTEPRTLLLPVCVTANLFQYVLWPVVSSVHLIPSAFYLSVFLHLSRPLKTFILAFSVYYGLYFDPSVVSRDFWWNGGVSLVQNPNTFLLLLLTVLGFVSWLLRA